MDERFPTRRHIADVPYCSLSTLLFSPFDLHRPFYTQRPFASTGIAPLLRYYGFVRLLLSLTLLAVLPSSLAGLSKHAHPLARPSGCLRQGPLRTFSSPVHAPFAPPRPRSPNRIGHEVLTSHMETCWSRGFRVNETLRRKFTCVAAYFFVRQDSRTSVAHPLARPSGRLRRGSLRKSFAFLRCIFARPVLLIVCRFLYDLAPFS